MPHLLKIKANKTGVLNNMDEEEEEKKKQTFFLNELPVSISIENIRRVCVSVISRMRCLEQSASASKNSDLRRSER